MNQNPFNDAPDTDSGDVEVAPAKPRLRRPSMWQAVMLNDDFTPMDFVVMVLRGIFDMNMAQAVAAMMQVHHLGKAVVGVYPKNIAELKVSDVTRLAQAEGHPLKVILERVEDEDKGEES